ncbi:FmdB family transcriptional regulator [Cellulomonas triticagri]|uniref:FmdB family transcriptional regulator n=1 Tax=Cellulomonas triticagri TaxID=2483352 RepID=A0A3M2IT76_9CELL|nr:FmdB family zinc ribbon protein [Cellulomonas triticagri]RMI03584.1 FmdB family transcriptional regulator [Cellulomonas triticagri]
MPTYAYTCTECGHAFDIHQSFSDAALTECPACGGKLRKVFSSVGVVFKGSGFYRNDSRSTTSSSTGASSSSSTSSSSTSTTSTSSTSTSSSSGATSSTGSSSPSTSSTSSSSAAKPAAG